jgi:hypothetical protein
MSVLDELSVRGLADAGTRPTTYSFYITVVAIAVSVVAVAPPTAVSLPTVFSGAVILGAAARYGNRVWLSRGYGVMLVGGLMHGDMGGSIFSTVGSVIAATVAWDVAENGIGIAEQLGTQAPARRAELVHAGAVIVTGLIAAAATTLVMFVFANNQPLPALVLLLIGLVFVLASVRQ